MKLKHKKDVKFETKIIGKAFKTDSRLFYFEKHYRDNLNITDYKDLIGSSRIYNGKAGCGKTTRLCKKIVKSENSICFSFTNKATENVKEKLRRDHNYEDVNKICHAFDSYFCEWRDNQIDFLKDKTIFIEEVSMTPNKWITLIYKIFTLYNNKIYMFGDKNQTSPVESGSQIFYDYE